jgi:predicted RNA-binding Zn ribbon-like protein
MGDTPETVNLLGGRLCLDFANTVDWDGGVPIKDEVLNEPDDVRRWGIRVGLGNSARTNGRELDAALELRRALHHAFAAIAAGGAPDEDALRSIAEHHAEAGPAGKLERDGDAWRLGWPAADKRRVRFAVAADAVALLADAERLARVRHCPGHDCGWLFLDTSGRRRWCSMDTCGSRAKMRRLYERRRAAAA